MAMKQNEPLWFRPIHRYTLGTLLCLIFVGAVWRWVQYEERPDIHTNSEKSRYVAEARFWRAYEEANASRRKGDYSKALSGYLTALDQRPNHKDALYYAGSLHLLLKQFEHALVYWNRLLELEPDAPRTLLQLGTLHACIAPENPLLDLNQALQFYNRAFELNREETGSMMMIAKLHLILGLREEARSWVRPILQTQPKHATATFLDGYILWKSDQIQEAASHYNASQSLFIRQYGTTFAGEGTTESGSAMLDGSQFCDPFEIFISDVWQDPDWKSAQQRFKELNDKILEWRSLAKVHPPEDRSNIRPTD